LTAASAAEPPLRLDLRPNGGNPSVPVMEDRLRFRSVITNTGTSPVRGLVAWIGLVEMDPGNEQPVDLEDWSANRAVAETVLEPGQSLHTEWPVRLIQSGDYRVVVSATHRNGDGVLTSPALRFHVRRKPVLRMGRILPVAAGVPLLLLGSILFLEVRERWEKKNE